MNIEIIPVTAFQQNCSLIWDDDKNAAIIDPGGEAERLIQRIEELNLNLKVILITHGHLDHVGAAMQLKQHFGIEIWGSQEEDKFLFESLPEQAQCFGLPNIEAFLPDFPRGDYETLISSIRTKLLPLNDDLIIIAGHGPYTTIGREKQTNPFLNR